MSPAPGSRLTGGCLCGDVQYEVTAPLERASHCHCGMCRKQHGAAFGTYAAARRDAFRWTSGERRIARFASSPGIERGFCSRCGSTLFWDEIADARKIGLALGTFDGDPGVRPALHIFVEDKASWYEITDGLPRHPTSPRTRPA